MRSVPHPAVLLLAGVLPARAAAQAIQVEARAPLALLLVAPNEETKASNLELVRHVRAELEAHTDLALRELDPRSEQTASCRGSLGCLAAVARADVAPRYLLVITNLARGAGEPDRLSATLIDTERAVELQRTADRSRPDWQAAADRAIEDDPTAIPVRAAGAALDTAAAGAWFSELLHGELRAELERSGHWEPFGTIAVEVALAGAAIELDGRVVATTASGVTTLAQVRAGDHEVAIAAADHERWATRVTVVRGGESRVVAEPVAIGMAPRLRTATIIAGLASVAAGVVLGAVAIERASAAEPFDCLVVSAQASGCTAGSELVAFGRGGEGFAPDAGGLPIAPFAYGAIGLGAAWSLGTVLFTGDDEVPWLPIIAGVVLAGASYGVATAVAGP